MTGENGISLTDMVEAIYEKTGKSFQLVLNITAAQVVDISSHSIVSGILTTTITCIDGIVELTGTSANLGSINYADYINNSKTSHLAITGVAVKSFQWL